MAPIVCVDWNGVRCSRAFLETLIARGYAVVVFKTRYPDDVWQWLRDFELDALVSDVTDRKPAAHVFVDDRAVCFRGDVDETLRAIEAFSAHREAPQTR